ncbi:MAG: hypothetical protein KAF91_26935 [Nostoc sp. TH1S01]|nr:hypothetical protein [Nostoc sp. TH1S01]
MKIPIQSLPVIRTDLIKPNTVADLIHAPKEQFLELELNLLHGADYNDPMKFLTSANYGGCQLLSENSMAMCLAAIGLF